MKRHLYDQVNAAMDRKLDRWLLDRRAKGDTLLELSHKIRRRSGLSVSQQAIANWIERAK